MSDFVALLNAEIVEAGRIPHPKVIERAKEVAEMLEDYYSDRNTLTPLVNPSEDIISFGSADGEKNGFLFYISFIKEKQELEDELVVWDAATNHYISIKGKVIQRDLDYVFGGKK